MNIYVNNNGKEKVMNGLKDLLHVVRVVMYRLKKMGDVMK
jgi:hypothetical protein